MTEFEKKVVLDALERTYAGLRFIRGNLYSEEFDEELRVNTLMDVIETEGAIKEAIRLMRYKNDEG